MEIIRLCRTFPRIDSPGAGLHCFNFSKYIKLQTLVFTKYSESPILSILKMHKFMRLIIVIYLSKGRASHY